jgi:hypothetical protein
MKKSLIIAELTLKLDTKRLERLYIISLRLLKRGESSLTLVEIVDIVSRFNRELVE